MITHTSDSHQIPSQNKIKSKLQIFKNCKKIQILKFFEIRCIIIYTEGKYLGNYMKILAINIARSWPNNVESQGQKSLHTTYIIGWYFKKYWYLGKV